MKKQNLLKYFQVTRTLLLFASATIFSVSCITEKAGIIQENASCLAFIVLMGVFLFIILTNGFYKQTSNKNTNTISDTEMDTKAKCSAVHFNRKQIFFALAVVFIAPYVLLSGINKDTVIFLRIFTGLLAFGTIEFVLWATFFHPWYDAIVTLCICVIVPFKICIILTTGFSDWFMLSYFPISCCFCITKHLIEKLLRFQHKQ